MSVFNNSFTRMFADIFTSVSDTINAGTTVVSALNVSANHYLKHKQVTAAYELKKNIDATIKDIQKEFVRNQQDFEQFSSQFSEEEMLRYQTMWESLDDEVGEISFLKTQPKPKSKPKSKTQPTE